MTNSGAASVHFAIYPNAYRNDGPWPYDVNTANSTSDSFAVATGGAYDFSCYGPDGFQRRFAGSVSADYHVIEAISFLNPSTAGTKIELVNDSASSVTFTVTNGYVFGGLASYIVPAHDTNIVSVGSETNSGFYDVTVTAGADSKFVRRFLGRVETVPPTAFVPSKNPGVLGDNVAFTVNEPGYGTPTGMVQFTTNGAPFGSPLPLNNGTASFNTASLGCGDNQIAAVYSGDLLNPPATNILDEVVSAPPPVIALNGTSPTTNWLGIAFVDPGATALDLCDNSLLSVTTFGTVNSALPGTYVVQYVAGAGPGNLATNTRTVFVMAEAQPSISAGAMLNGGEFQFTFTGPPSQPYRVLTSTNPSPAGVWDTLSSGNFGTNLAVFTESNVMGQSMRFYRVVSP
jgi:hypothetical protein